MLYLAVDLTEPAAYAHFLFCVYPFHLLLQICIISQRGSCPSPESDYGSGSVLFLFPRQQFIPGHLPVNRLWKYIDPAGTDRWFALYSMGYSQTVCQLYNWHNSTVIQRFVQSMLRCASKLSVVYLHNNLQIVIIFGQFDKGTLFELIPEPRL